MFHPEMRRLLPVLLWQIGLHLEENVLPLFYKVLGLLDGLLLFRTHMGFASGEETRCWHQDSLCNTISTCWYSICDCLRQGHPKDREDGLEASPQLHLQCELLCQAGMLFKKRKQERGQGEARHRRVFSLSRKDGESFVQEGGSSSYLQSPCKL